MSEKEFNSILGHISKVRIPLLTKKEIHDFVDRVQQLQGDNTKLRAEIVALEGVAEIMDCGHERRFSTLQIGATDNKSVCTACEVERLRAENEQATTECVRRREELIVMQDRLMEREQKTARLIKEKAQLRIDCALLRRGFSPAALDENDRLRAALKPFADFALRFIEHTAGDPELFTTLDGEHKLLNYSNSPNLSDLRKTYFALKGGDK